MDSSETCTQECLILGHSDNCWMPPSLTQYQQSNPPLPSFGFQQGWGQGTRPEGRHTLGRPIPKDDIDKGQGGPRPQFYNTCERQCTSEDPVKVIPLANFTPAQQAPAGSNTTFIHEHQL
uniref:PCDH9 protein n=1 Tax=Crocodylus porosus TaxID=8502 RepID=A0A7M4EUG5_CROPO